MPFTPNVWLLPGASGVPASFAAADTMPPFLRPFVVPYRTHTSLLSSYIATQRWHPILVSPSIAPLPVPHPQLLPGELSPDLLTAAGHSI